MPHPRLFLVLALLTVTGLRCSSPSVSGALGGDVFTPEGPPAYRAEGLRIATFNGEFLFDGEDDEGGADFDWKGDPAAARAHMEAFAAAVRPLNADLVLIPETEHLGVLEALVSGPLADMGYEAYLVDGTDTFTGQDVGLISRVPIDEIGRTDERVEVGLSDQTYGVSKNLWARFTLGGMPTTLIGVHFLARPDARDRKDRREAQAEVIRRLVAREAASGRAVIALGDFNDFDDVTRDARGSQPITDVLARIKRAGPSPDDDLRNVLADVPQEDRFTAFYDRNGNDVIDRGEFSAIDHILLSPALYARLREVHFVQAHDPRLVSDHFPIVVTLGLN